MTMIETAEIVAERYQITRERQDEFALQSHYPHRGGSGRRPVRRRDRPAALGDESGRQGDQRRLG